MVQQTKKQQQKRNENNNNNNNKTNPNQTSKKQTTTTTKKQQKTKQNKHTKKEEKKKVEPLIATCLQPRLTQYYSVRAIAGDKSWYRGPYRGSARTDTHGTLLRSKVFREIH